MQSKAKDVDSYLKEVPEDRLPALNKIRQLCLEELKGYDEAMKYGGPCYEKNKIIEVGFASQKHFIGLYILKRDVMEKYKDLLKAKGISTGKGCIRYSKPDKINFEVVRKLLRGTFTSAHTTCG
jgi:uncharacterized protein YdhG (YjbR/CyaY superfamily)